MADQEHHEHIVQPGTYLAIILTLLVLTGLTVGAAYVNLGTYYSDPRWKCAREGSGHA